MPAIKLWYSPGACSIAPHILLKEAGVEFEAILIDVMQGAPESLRKINPKGRVPVLAIDNEVITELPAVCTAISQLVPQKKLLGSTNLEIVRAYEWMNYLSGTLHGQGFGGLFRPARYTDDPSLYPAIREKSMKTILECYETIENSLKTEHAVGSGFTAVDANLYVFYRWGASRLGGDMAVKFPKYAKLVAELLRRDSVQAALKIEDVESYSPKL